MRIEQLQKEVEPFPIAVTKSRFRDNDKNEEERKNERWILVPILRKAKIMG